MSDQRVGAALRAVRLRRNLRQADVARIAGVSAALVSEIERGRIARVTLESIRLVSSALDVHVDVVARWRGGELDRLLNARHNELGAAVAAFLKGLGWDVLPEVSFAIGGERGVIDILAWHPQTRTVIVIELKTEIVDPQELLATLGRKTRLAPRIAREHGWESAHIATWLVVAEGSTNRHRLDRFGALFRATLPSRSREMAAWLRAPLGSIAGVTFFSISSRGPIKQSFAGRQRARPRHERSSAA